MSEGGEAGGYDADEGETADEGEDGKRAKTVMACADSDPDGQFSCDQCDKTFAKHSSLARHKYEHSGTHTPDAHSSLYKYSFILFLVLGTLVVINFILCCPIITNKVGK